MNSVAPLWIGSTQWTQFGPRESSPGEYRVCPVWLRGEIGLPAPKTGTQNSYSVDEKGSQSCSLACAP